MRVRSPSDSDGCVLMTTSSFSLYTFIFSGPALLYFIFHFTVRPVCPISFLARFMISHLLLLFDNRSHLFSNDAEIFQTLDYGLGGNRKSFGSVYGVR